MTGPPSPRLSDDLARGIFTGRVAIWGVAVPLAALVVAWCAILVQGDEDAALASGARWGTVFAWWLGGIVAALVVRRIASHALLARRRRARREAFHRLVCEETSLPPARRQPSGPGPARRLAEVMLGLWVWVMLVALASPVADGHANEAQAVILQLYAGVALFVAFYAVATLKRSARRAETRQAGFGKWKARREARAAEEMGDVP
ncbi:MAG: hypothetical protein ACYS9X_08060 [Planctomycetota bacterium]|jgi:hypothetical protein